MFTQKNILFYSIAVIFFIALKFIFKNFDNQQLYFLLKPTNSLVEISTNSHSFFSNDLGFYHEKFNIIIDKSCSGYNLLLMIFLMLSFLGIKNFKKNWLKFFSIPASLFLAYSMTVFVNASRIFASILLQKKFAFFQFVNAKVLHESIGIFVNVFFLILIYLFVEFIINKHFIYEKSA